VAEQRDQDGKPSRYRLIETLEEGVAGKLYRARDTQDDSTVLLKLVPRAMSSDPEFRRYFYERWVEREATIEHPNVARIVEVGQIGEQYFAVVEELPGERLSDRLKTAQFDPLEVLEIMRQVAEALRAAHRENIVHGHLKPTDIFLTQDQRGRPLVKVLFLDLGTAAADGMLSMFGDLSGPPKYLAPEVIRGRMPDARGDLFALGVLGYEMVTGQEPFPSEHPIGYLFANCEAEMVPAHEARAGVPKALSLVVSRCLARNPQSRYGSAQKLIDDLDRCTQSLQAGHVSVVPAGTDSAFAQDYEIEARAPRRGARRLAASPLNVLALAVALVAVVSLALMLVREEGAGTQAPEVPQLSTQVPPDESASEPVAKGLSAEELAASRLQARTEGARAALQGAQTDWGQRYSPEGDYYLGILAFKQVVDGYSDVAEVAVQAGDWMSRIYCEWAEDELDREEFRQAAGHYREALQVGPSAGDYVALARRKLPTVLARWADDSQRRGQYEEALERYELVARDYPESPEAALLGRKKPEIEFSLGYDLWKEDGRLSEARGRLQFVLDNYPDSPAAAKCKRQLPLIQLEIARQALASGEMLGALAELERLKLDYPKSGAAITAGGLEAEVLYELFRSARAEGEAGTAGTRFEALAKKYPGSPWTAKATAEKLGLAPEAGKPPMEPAAAAADYEQAQGQMERLEFAEATRVFEELVRSAPPDGQVKALALEKIPESRYYGALGLSGVGKKDECTAALEGLSNDFAHTTWGLRAAEALEEMKGAPEGMVYVPEGPFYMGASHEELVRFLQPLERRNVFEDPDVLESYLDFWYFSAELSRHVAKTGAFYIDRTEVTNEEYKRFVDATGHPAPVDWRDGRFRAGEARMPVRNVTHEDASAYAESAGKRLPTEAEWEKAARGVDGRLYPWGSVWDKKFCQQLRKGDAGPVVVGSFKAKASPYGCLDMLGNVREWTDSWLAPYEGSEKRPDEDPFGVTARVRRGGSWTTLYPKPIPTRCSVRYAPEPGGDEAKIALQQTGFRCVKDIE
jgi:iron(II)-dependent oxidoreductase